MKKPIFIIILWNTITIVLLLLIIEIVIRIAIPEIQLSGLDRRILKSDAYYTTVGLRKNIAGKSKGILKQVDALGFWKYAGDKKTAKRKILTLGDSATMGIGVENDSTFIGLLSSLFNSLEFYNASLIGYSSYDYLNITKSLIQFENNNLGLTDIYIFWCLNDIYSNFPYLNSPESKQDYLKIITDFLIKNLKLYHLLKKTFSDRPKAYYSYDKTFYTADNRLMKESIKNLEQVAEIADSANTNFYLFLLPYEYQIRNKDNSQIFQPQETIQTLLKDSKINIIDCSSSFTRNNLESSIYYLYGDGIHFSRYGHKVMADFIADKLRNDFLNATEKE